MLARRKTGTELKALNTVQFYVRYVGQIGVQELKRTSLLVTNVAYLSNIIAGLTLTLSALARC